MMQGDWEISGIGKHGVKSTKNQYKLKLKKCFFDFDGKVIV